MSSGSAILSRLRSRYLRLKLTEIAVLSIAIALISYTLLLLFNISALTQILISTIFGISVFIWRFFQTGLHRVTEESVATFLNTKYNELEASTDLILTTHELSPLVRLQQIKTQRSLEALSKTIRFPNRLAPLIVFFLAALTTCIVVQETGFIFSITDSSGLMNDSKSLHDSVSKKLPAEISKATITVKPPAYTRIAKYNLDDLNVTVQENSTVSWELEFSGNVKNASLLSSAQDSLKFSKIDNRWKLESVLDRNGFYQIIWNDGSNHSSEYYKIIVLKDKPPGVKIEKLNQFTQVPFDAKQIIEVNSSLHDDYGLTDAYIIATVSKGSGESVKFREEKIPFSSPKQISGKQIKAQQILDLKKLGLEPGDELYFYAEAFDNKTPLANRSRTETYFIVIPDTTQDVMAADGGLGVDLMPEYFRSQRQIIIDTEKLIREKKTISKKEFNARSNELGYDQKVLRLRYGQFLGEEAESGVGPTGQHAEEDHDENETEKPEDMIKEFGHQHDTENEHNLVEEKDQSKRDVDGGKKENLLEGFIHEHDNEESATFFYQSLKLKLKAALAQMWDAELYLRLYEPDKSLPYQYTALKLLKEISNDSRIYVHRTGFEPPPIKEEKRLSADLTEIPNANRAYDGLTNKRFPKISEALRLTEKLITQKNLTLSQADKNILTQSGSELSQLALENPVLLQGLSALNEIINGTKEIKSESLITLRKAYWIAIPTQPTEAGKSNSMLHELDKKLIEQFELRNP